MEIVTKIAPIALALIMLGLGLGLTTQDFARVLKTPKDFLIGFISQLIILPIVAFILIKILGRFLEISPEIALGVMIIAAAPGGITSNVLTKFANGDVALSVSLTAVISIISIITVPLIVFNSADFLEVSFADENINITGTALKMALVVAVPVILGMIIRKFADNFISSKISFIDKITGILFLIVFIAIWIEEKDNIVNYLAQAGLVVLILNIVMMIIAYYLAKTFASGIKQMKCISLECGLQNGTLAVFVATEISNDIVYMIPTAAYALIMYITGFIFIYILRNKI
ncbi:MAG: bile acid:sodium symporter family protein [Pelagibacterales bacterium]|nr:bile acid:sodium symporter family protein [Pelagibacterales bacterium]